jgi:hypothetical protein
MTIKTKKHSRKHFKQHHSKILTKTKTKTKHSYYIVHCYNKKYELNYKYLEEHLKKLSINPDTNAIEMINNKDIQKLKINNKKIENICVDNFIFNDFDKKILKADVFFLNTINNVINKRFNYYPKYFVNKINYSIIDKIFNKFSILSIIKTNLELEKYYPKTFKINETKKYEFPKWYILRPLDSNSGIDIFYINNKKDLTARIEYYNKTKNYKGNVYNNDVIASEYISNPLLFKERKFHLRLYLLISICNNIFNSFFLKYGEILTAKEPFNMLEPFTKDKHDSHFYSTNDDYNYPKDFINDNLNKNITENDKNELWNKIIEIMKPISKTMEKHKKDLIYSDVKNCYYVFGIDIMIRDTLEPAFIEINYSPGFNYKKDINRDIFSKIYFDWINETVLEPLFKYNDPLKARKHSTYITIS